MPSPPPQLFFARFRFCDRLGAYQFCSQTSSFPASSYQDYLTKDGASQCLAASCPQRAALQGKNYRLYGKTVNTPRRPYEKERLDKELKLCGTYGELFGSFAFRA